jgi:hypothetical protein
MARPEGPVRFTGNGNKCPSPMGPGSYPQVTYLLPLRGQSEPPQPVHNRIPIVGGALHKQRAVATRNKALTEGCSRQHSGNRRFGGPTGLRPPAETSEKVGAKL